MSNIKHHYADQLAALDDFSDFEMESAMNTRTVTIPACSEHEGFWSKAVTLNWVCPKCGGPRGEPFETLSYDGSRRLGVHGWRNECGHVDLYNNVREEAKLEGV